MPGPQFHYLKKTFLEYVRLHAHNRSLPQGLGTVTLLATIGNGQIDAMTAGAKLELQYTDTQKSTHRMIWENRHYDHLL